MRNAEQKAALEGIFIMLMHSNDITIEINGGEITADFSSLAKANIAETNKAFCDLAALAENALQQLSKDGEIVTSICTYFAALDRGSLFPYSGIAVSIIAAMNTAVFEHAAHEVFTWQEMQALLLQHPDYPELLQQDLIDNPATTDHYNAGEAGFTA